MTPRLADFIARYEQDDNEWWRLECGHHQNLFEEAVEENSKLRALVKALCSDPSPFGSEAFRKVRDQINEEHKALLFEVLGG